MSLKVIYLLLASTVIFFKNLNKLKFVRGNSQKIKNIKVFLLDSKNQVVAIPSADPKELTKIMQEETSPEGKKSFQLLNQFC